VRDLIGGTPEMPRGVALALLVLRILLALFFVAMAARNLSGDERMAADFERWGFPAWFRVATALLQLLGGVLLVSSATAPFGAALLTRCCWARSRRTCATTRRRGALAAGLPGAVVAILVVYRPPLLR